MPSRQTADRDAAGAAVPPDPPVSPEALWLLISDLVLDNQRRRDVADALGISFGRVRAIRRLARRPMTMGTLADALGIDPPNATTLVDELEALGLVQRRADPADRRVRLVAATGRGVRLARRADAILATPPAALRDLSPDDLVAVHRILAAAVAAQAAE